jgi:hypothetical protein
MTDGWGCPDHRSVSNNARYFWRPQTGYLGNNQWTTDTFTTSWRLPSNVNCAGGCVLQW